MSFEVKLNMLNIDQAASMREERSKSSVMTVMFASYTSYFYEHLFSCFYHGIVTDILVY